MKLVKYLITGAGLLSLGAISMSTWAGESEQQLLRDQLRQIDTLQALFEQQVFDERGEVQEELSGTLILQRPHFLRWETEVPDHSVVVADGDAVWYYSAFIEQLSIFDQAQNLEQNPMLVLLSNDENAWAEFEVTRDSNGIWHISNDDTNYGQANLSVGFAEGYHINYLRMDDGQGQVSEFNLREVVLNEQIAPAYFRVDVDDTVEIDDQRSADF